MTLQIPAYDFWWTLSMFVQWAGIIGFIALGVALYVIWKSGNE